MTDGIDGSIYREILDGSKPIKLSDAGITSLRIRITDQKLSFGMEQNYPNPFNPITTISYQLRESGLVQLRVYDMLGREIALLVNEERVSGKHNITFDASDLPSGVYIYSLRVNYGSGSFVQHRKMTVLK